MSKFNLTRCLLRFSCTDLHNADLRGKSDPYIKVLLNGAECGRTETITDSLNPSFTTPVPVDYFFEELQKLEIVVLDKDVGSSDDHLGKVETTLDDVVAAPGAVYEADLLRGKKFSGKVAVTVEQTESQSVRVKGEFSGFELEKMDRFGKSDPYFLLKLEIAPRTVFFRSKTIPKNLNPHWEPFKCDIPPTHANVRFIVEVFDEDRASADDLIGATTPFYLSELAQNPRELELINPKKVGKRKYKNSGSLSLKSFTVVELPSFFHYVYSGCRLNFSVAIDFTASNGDPSNPASLHYFDPSKPNQYVQALSAVGQVLNAYDTDHMYPALGFGGKLPSGETSHNFCLNGQPDPHCYGIEGVIAAYQQALGAVRLSGPTNMAPVIKHMRELSAAGAVQPGNIFFNVLLIITDGAITDLDATISEIVAASREPMAIVIVGVGAADFSRMQALDGDGKVLKDSSGRVAAGDCVQFVKFNDYLGMSADRLAADVLREIPKRVVDVFVERGIFPPRS
mmetsp:Transcript_10701/g.28145  ORF Transcript_10701/g.28145 Transcript_10701/m.28145 type:complete len:510 (+) Transcript_10701:1126-2655(+)